MQRRYTKYHYYSITTIIAIITITPPLDPSLRSALPFSPSPLLRFLTLSFPLSSWILPPAPEYTSQGHSPKVLRDIVPKGLFLAGTRIPARHARIDVRRVWGNDDRYWEEIPIPPQFVWKPPQDQNINNMKSELFFFFLNTSRVILFYTMQCKGYPPGSSAAEPHPLSNTGGLCARTGW